MRVGTIVVGQVGIVKLKNNMKTIIRTKLLDENHIEMREHELFKSTIKVILCSSKDYKRCYHLNEPFQTYTVSEQRKGVITNTQISAFYPYKNYRMYKLIWKPKGEITQKQVDDKEIEFDNKRGVAILP